MKRPAILHGKTIKVKTDCGNMYITLNWDEKSKRFLEARIVLGKSGNCQCNLLSLIGILISDKLHGEATLEDKIKFLKRHAEKISCGTPFQYEGEKYISCIDLVAWLCIDELKKEKKTDGEVK